MSVFAPRLTVIAGLVLAAPALAGGVEDGDLPIPDPPGTWRMVTRDNATTTSTCIGRPETPLCAIESVIACFVRRQRELCWIGRGRTDTRERPFQKFPGGAIVVHKYRVVSAKRLAEEDIPYYWRLACEDAWEPGDLRVEIEWLYCTQRNGRLDCGEQWGFKPTPVAYIVRRTTRGWRVVIWETLEGRRIILKHNGCYGG